ncbi:MAG: NADPH-dependent 7-cyano-7-deazaguanine reductase QueF [Halieaceae bacterium]
MTLLGQNSPVPERYAPELLFAIPRAEARDSLGLDPEQLPFRGEDVWHAWELAWLAPGSQPRLAVGRFSIPASSPSLVESKSFKLYLNSLNQEQFDSAAGLANTLVADLSTVAGAAVSVEILELEDAALAITPLPGECIDNCSLQAVVEEPKAELLLLEKCGDGEEQVLHSHALRSLCPVTAQPDWASVIVHVGGARVDPASLLTYIHAYRRHQEFHEQCVERMFSDLQEAGACGHLSVQALYTRRGGLDINPWRSTDAGPAPRLRTARQ